VVNEHDEVPAVFFTRLADGRFAQDAQDQLRAASILLHLDQRDVQVDPEPKQKRGTKKAKQTITVAQKILKRIEALASKFVPEQQADDSEEEDEAAEEDPAAAKKASTGEEMEEEDLSKGRKKIKLSSGKNAKASEKPATYKKGVWNPNVQEAQVFQQLESKSAVPSLDCSPFNANRELIRAAFTGNKPLFEKLLKAERKLSSIKFRWGVENKTDVLKVLIDHNNEHLLITYLEYLRADKLAPVLRDGNDISIESTDTGYNNKFAYGVATRKVNLSRGGRQGNNAFVEEEDDSSTGLSDEDVEAILKNPNASPSLLKTILSYFPDDENRFIRSSFHAVLVGNTDLFAFLLQKAHKNGGYGTSDFFLPALTAKTKKTVGDIKAASCTKKAFDIGGLTPLHLASLNPHTEVLEHLLAATPEAGVMDSAMDRPVHFAACAPTPSNLKLLEKKSMNFKELNNLKTTPLMFAARGGRLENVKFLLQNDRSLPAYKNKLGYSALHYAAEHGHPLILKALVDAGVKANQPGPDRKTILHLAVVRDDLPLVKLLVEELGLKVTVKDKFKRTPLNLACKNGCMKIASYLLQQGSEFDLPDSSGNTPIHYACAYGYPEIIDLLFRAGASPNSLNSWNYTPTAIALLKGYSSCLNKILENPATDVNCVDQEGKSLLTLSLKKVSEEKFKLVELLVREKKANPNLVDSELKMTAFDHFCNTKLESQLHKRIKATMNTEEVKEATRSFDSLVRKFVKLLLEAGSDVNNCSKSGDSSVLIAAKQNNWRVFDALIDHPSLNLSLVNAEGLSILSYLSQFAFKPSFLIRCEKVLHRLGSKAADLMNCLAKDAIGFTNLGLFIKNTFSKVKASREKILENLKNDFLRDKKYASAKEALKNKAKTGKAAKTSGLKGGARSGSQSNSSKQSDSSSEEEDNDDGEDEDEEEESNTSEEEEEGEEDGDSDNSKKQKKQPVIITEEELKRLEKEADNIHKDRVEELKAVVRLFIKAGGNFNARCKPHFDNLKETKDFFESVNFPVLQQDNFDFFNSYETAVKRMNGELITKLTKHFKTSTGQPVASEIVSHLNLGLLKLLVEEAKVDLNITSVYGHSILHILCQNFKPEDAECLEVLKYVLSKAAHLVNKVTRWFETPFTTLAKFKCFEGLDLLKSCGANINFQGGYLKSALMNAVQKADLPTVEYLTSIGCNPNLVDNQNRTCMHISMNQSTSSSDVSNEIENCLLSAGANLNAKDNYGRTPLHYAFVSIADPLKNAFSDPIETVSNMISRGKVDIDVRDVFGNTPLNYAAQRGAVICAIHLLKHGATIDNKNNDGNTPLTIALINGHQNLVVILIQNKAAIANDCFLVKREVRLEREKNVENPKKNEAMQEEKIEEKKENSSDEDEARLRREEKSDAEEEDEKQEDPDVQRKTPFSLAVKQNWQGVAFLLLEYGFDIGLAVIECFRQNKFNYVYTLLLKKSESGVYQTQDEKKRNLTHYLASTSNSIDADLSKKILKKLETNKLDFGSFSDEGCNSLHYACAKANVDLARILLDKKLNPNQKSRNGNTPLGFFKEAPIEKLAKFLETAKPFGLDPNLRFTFAKKEHTLLTYLAQEQSSEDSVVQNLLKLVALGCDINAPDSDGFAPVTHFIKNNAQDCVKVLMKETKVNLKTKDSMGRSLIHHVVTPLQYGSYENVELLSLLAKHLDVNDRDNQGNPPLFYARQQLSGRMAAALLKLGAKEEVMSEGIRRVATSILNELDFPEAKFDYEQDYEHFIERCQQEATQYKQNIKQKFLPDGCAQGNYEVCFEADGEPYDLYMVKVDISKGYYSGNVFYRMQILREPIRDVYILFTKWGRVGETGQYQQTPFSKIEEARAEFCNIFKAKSGNLWEERSKFKKVEGKYRLLPVIVKTKVQDFIQPFDYLDPKLPRSELPKEIYTLIRRLCNYKIVIDALKSYNFNQEILSLHNLTKERIEEASEVLKALAIELEGYNWARTNRKVDKLPEYAEEISRLTSEFYELIPTTNHSEQAIPPILNTSELENLSRMITDLTYFEIVIRLIGAATFNMKKVNPIDYCFNCLNLKILRLERNSIEFKIIQ